MNALILTLMDCLSSLDNERNIYFINQQAGKQEKHNKTKTNKKQFYVTYSCFKH